MFRIPSALGYRNVPKVFGKWQSQRYQSQYQGQRSGSNKLAIGAAGVSVLTAGIIGYGSYSKENRKSVEQIIPGSDLVFDLFLGPIKPDIPIPPPTLYKPKKVKAKKEEEPKLITESTIETKPEINNEKEDIPIIVEEAAPPIDIPPNNEPSSPSPPEMIIITPSAQEREQNKLTEILIDLKSELNKSITEALSSAEAASIAIREHAEQAFKAIDSADERLFSTISEYSDKKNNLVNEAEDKISEAFAKLEKFRGDVQSFVDSGDYKGHRDLEASQESVADYNYSLQNIKNIILEAVNDGKAIGEYGELVDAGRKQFAAEVRSLAPDVKLGETSEKLTSEELNLLLAHAHRKVENLQRLLAKHQVLEHDSFKQAIHHQRKEELGLLENKLKVELEKQEQLLNIQFNKTLDETRDNFEDELRSQLKRQAAAHSDHLSEVLSVQERDLENKWQLKLSEEVQTERDQYHRAIAEMRGQVDGLNSALIQRAKVDKEAYQARRLWLACESLKAALSQSHKPGTSFEERFIPLKEHVSAISDASGEDNVFVKTVLKALPVAAINRGVYNESSLKERFDRVECVAKKCAMVGDNGASLITYLLSYIQNFFVVDAFNALPSSEQKDEEVAIDNLTTYDILARTRYCLNKDDLLQAVKYMNLLRGEPRQISSDWIKEARLVLETRLIMDTLLLHAAATAVRAL